MYEEYFGLERPPFKITPDTSLFYEGGKRGDILGALAYAIHRGEGIIKVVGEVGSGKTMLCRMLQLKLPDTVEIVYIANPSVSAEDILFVIAHELSLPVDRTSSKHEVMHMLQDYLLQRHMENKQVVLFVEEAQGMPLETLEEIRLLSNLETDENKLLQIILFGQPELDQNLAQQSIRQLRERITHNFELEPLTRDEIHSYLNFRMRQVGYTGPELISSTVAKKVEQHSAGLLRRINIIADKILLSAFAEGTHNRGSKYVTAAVNDSSFHQGSSRKLRLLWWFLPLLLLALVLALYQTRSQWLSVAASVVQPSPGEETVAPTLDPATEPAALPASDAGESTTLGSDSEQSIAADTSDPEIGDSVSADSASATNSSAPATRQADAAAVDAASIELASLNAEVDGLVSQIEMAVREARVSSDSAPAPTSAPPANEAVAAGEDAAVAMAAPAADNAAALTADYRQWLNARLEYSQRWLSEADGGNMSIQVMMRNKSAARELVYYLRKEWPLDLSQTYIYEVKIDGRSIYRVFYSEYDTLTGARAQINALPDSIKVNSPYVHSIYRMREALL